MLYMEQDDTHVALACVRPKNQNKTRDDTTSMQDQQ